MSTATGAEVCRLRDRLRLLSETTTAFADATTDYPRLIATISKRLADVVGDTCSVFFLSDDAKSLIPTAIHSSSPEVADQVRTFLASAPLVLADHPAARRVIETGEPFVMRKLDADAMRAHTTGSYVELIEKLKDHSLLVVPLRQEGRSIGILTLSRYRPTSPPFDDDDLELAQMLATHAALAISNARAYVEAQSARNYAEDTEAENERLRRELDAEARLAAIVDSSDDAIIGKTLDGTVTSWNPAAERLFEYAASEMIGKPIAILLPPGREDEEPRILARLRRGEVDHFDTVRRKKDGSLVHVSVTSSPIADANGRLIGASKVARDITARKRAEDELSRAKETAEAVSRELESFSYSVAHDLRAPLRGMNGFAQMLLDDHSDELGTEGKEWLHEILTSASRMGELIDALLSLSRLTRSTLERETVDLSAVVHAAEERFSKAEPARKVAWIVRDDLKAQIDPVLARDLVDNLVGNAWKFTVNTSSPRIEFGATETEHGHAFFIRDNGAGFDMAYANKLFAPFQRLHTVHEFPGTGIGLASVQRIVHRHGGSIWAEGSVNHGATFYFTLPTRAMGGAA